MSPTRLLIASAVFGSWAFPTLAAPLTPEDTVGHIGETATVCGVVASAKYEANAKSQPTLLDLGQGVPRTQSSPRSFMAITARNSGRPRPHSAASASV